MKRISVVLSPWKQNRKDCDKMMKFGARTQTEKRLSQTLSSFRVGALDVGITLFLAHSLHGSIRVYSTINPFTPKSDQCQISPGASAEILHPTVWRTWLFIAYSDER